MADVLIREEGPEDVGAIDSLMEEAFKPMPFSDGTEVSAIRRLREDGNLTISLVAMVDEKIIGHVAFSPVTIDGRHDGWFGLGPVSVDTSRQRQGTGKSLMLAGLQRLKERGALGCVLIGEPKIYSKVGFISDGRLTYRDLPTSLVQGLGFNRMPPAGEIVFSVGLE